MINVLLKGRIGNNLFQIAMGISLAKKNNTEVCFYTGNYFAPFPDNCYLYEYLKQFKDNLLRNVKIIEGFPPNQFRIVEHPQFEYIPISFEQGYLIEGFFQSYLYFNIGDIIQVFRIDEKNRTYILSKYGELLNKDITSINVRRGDYINELDNHPICSHDYFKSAIRIIGEEKNYIIISDDIEWCKKKFEGKNFYFVENENPLIDLYIQTLCTNNIISNSTFSWWGAMLNENNSKKVICPTPWFGVAKAHINTKNLIPPDWVQVQNKMTIYHTLRGYKIWYIRRIDYFIRTKIMGHSAKIKPNKDRFI